MASTRKGFLGSMFAALLLVVGCSGDSANGSGTASTMGGGAGTVGQGIGAVPIGGAAPGGTSGAAGFSIGGSAAVGTGGGSTAGTSNFGGGGAGADGSSSAGGGSSASGSAGSGASAGAGGTSTGRSSAGGGGGGGHSSAGTGGTGGTSADGGTGGTGGSGGTGETAGAGGFTGSVTAACPGAAPDGLGSDWCSCEQWGQWSAGSTTYYNDIWGSGAGAQCIWATSGGEWGVAANHPDTSGIKAYPNVSLSPAQVIGSIGSYTSSFDVTVPSSGAYETAYDIWVKGTTSTRIEIMLWMNYTGAVGPIASSYDASGAVADKPDASVGGHTWNVYFGTNGANDVVSFVRTSNTSAGSVDVKAILEWIIANHTQYGAFTSSWTLDQVQFGFEITSDGGSTQAFVTNSFSVTSS